MEYNYQLHNTSLTELNSCKYLGVTIQSDLKWSQHIHQIAVKANCTLSLIKRNLRLASKSPRETAYFTLVRSQLEYASTVWSPWLCKDKLELEKVQRLAARFVCNNYDPMYCVTATIDQLNWKIIGITLIYVYFLRLCSNKFMFLPMTFHHQHPQL